MQQTPPHFKTWTKVTKQLKDVILKIITVHLVWGGGKKESKLTTHTS